MHHRWKLITVIAALVAAAVTVMTAAGGAGAAVVDPGNVEALNPQTTNVPYVAWAGEQIRFMKCYTVQDLDGHGITAQTPAIAHFNVVNPLIDTPSSVTPTWEGGSIAGIGNLIIRDGSLCASGTYYSASPGLADILLNVTGLDGNTTLLPKHDFLGIWLRMNAPTIAELPGGGDNGTGSFNLGSNSGDPVDPGIVGVTVTGSFPFANKTWNFPGTTDWSDLAKMLATDTNPATISPGAAWYRWDIHDNNGLDEGHPKVAGCTAATASLPAGVLDGVDNCAGGYNFSRIAGYTYATGSAIGMLGGTDVGPFDPLAPETLLGNGVVDASDVPMPAAQINLALTGHAGMAGATGALIMADKDQLFSRDGTGSSKAHNLYAPYNSQYIPATSRDAISSGVDGPQNINDVAGFQTYGQYINWDILNGVGGEGNNVCLYPDGSPIPHAASNEGEFLSGTVYTDEHGKAEVLYDPNAGFSLAEDANGRCISFLTGPSTFTSDIQATAVYPYKKVAAAQPSNILTKTVVTASLKTVSCVPKGPFEAFCVETVKDPWGNLMSGVDVSFTANSVANANIQADAAKLGAFNTTDQTFLGSDFAQRIVQLRTGPNGQAGVVVTDSIAADCVNVRAENIDTRVNGSGVSVFTDFNPATGAVCNAGNPVTPPAPGPSTPPSPGSTSNNNAAPVVVVTNAAPNTTGTVTALPGGTPSVVSVNAPSKKVTVVSISAARFVMVGHNRFLGVQLKSTAKTAKVNITLVGKNGKVIGHVIKTVKTNHFVRVMKVGATVKTVRLAALTA